MHIIPVLSFASWMTLVSMVIMNPSDTVPLQTSGTAVMIFFISSSLGAYIIPYLTLRIKTDKRFFVIFTSAYIILTGIALYAGTAVHRDFYTYTTQLILFFLIIFLSRIDDTKLVMRKSEIYPLISIGVFTVFFFWSGWLMMMSYAIVTRAEPRWIESIAYNIINGITGLVLLYTGATLRASSKKSVYWNNDEIYLDRRNISTVLSPQESRIVIAFLSTPGHNLNCSALLKKLRGTDMADDDKMSQCEQCIIKRWTATQCSAYRNFKNRITDAKKYLELLQIGAIVPNTENARDIKEQGWRLRLFDDVHLVIEKNYRKILPHVRQ